MIAGATLVAMLLSSPSPGGVSLPSCNARVAGELDARLADAATRPASDADRQFASIQAVVSDAAREEEVVSSTCSMTDAVPIETQLHAIAGLAYVMQADLARARFGEHCPTAKDVVAEGFLAAGWHELNRAPAPATQSPLKAVADAITSRAADVHFTLPPIPDATEYWVQTVQRQASAAVAACNK